VVAWAISRPVMLTGRGGWLVRCVGRSLPTVIDIARELHTPVLGASEASRRSNRRCQWTVMSGCYYLLLMWWICPV